MKRLVALAAVLLAGCGYHVGGHADLLPQSIHTIAVPAFSNNSSRYRLTESLPAAISREFLSRTRYRVVNDLNEADAILTGGINNVMTAPIIADQKTGRAAIIQIHVYLNLKLTERKTGKVLYERTGLEVRERYEISSDQNQYFDESSPAIQRLSQQVARQVVSSILEAF